MVAVITQDLTCSLSSYQVLPHMLFKTWERWAATLGFFINQIIFLSNRFCKWDLKISLLAVDVNHLFTYCLNFLLVVVVGYANNTLHDGHFPGIPPLQSGGRASEQELQVALYHCLLDSEFEGSLPSVKLQRSGSYACRELVIIIYRRWARAHIKSSVILFYVLFDCIRNNCHCWIPKALGGRTASNCTRCCLLRRHPRISPRVLQGRVTQRSVVALYREKEKCSKSLQRSENILRWIEFFHSYYFLFVLESGQIWLER